MKKIEQFDEAPNPELTSEIRTFWTQNVNAEKIMGKNVTDSTRGSSNYFQDLQQQRYRSHRHLLPWIESMDKGKSVLEIGCGVGLDAYAMTQKGMQVTAVDLTEVGIETVKSRFKEEGLTAEFKVADACELPFADNTFDYVYSFGVLHHVADTQKAINEVYRVLKPGGKAKIMLYHRRSLNELVHRMLKVPFEDRDEICPVVRRYTKDEVKHLFASYRSVSQQLDFVYGEGYGRVFHLTPLVLYRFLSKYFGWHIMITAEK